MSENEDPYAHVCSDEVIRCTSTELYTLITLRWLQTERKRANPEDVAAYVECTVDEAMEAIGGLLKKGFIEHVQTSVGPAINSFPVSVKDGIERSCG